MAAAVAVGTAAVAAAPAIAAGTGIFMAYSTTKQAEKARSSAQSRFESEFELQEKQAGEYYQLSQAQMELQSQSSQITTLANLIAAKRQPAQAQQFTTPAVAAAPQGSIFDRMNRAIGSMFTVAA